MDINNIIETICKIENPYIYEHGVWAESLQGFIMTHETAEENSAYYAFEECRDKILLLLAAEE